MGEILEGSTRVDWSACPQQKAEKVLSDLLYFSVKEETSSVVQE